MRKRIWWTMVAFLLAMSFAFGVWMVSTQMNRPRNATLVCAEEAVRI
ncbi:MAG: hypothetical protein LUI13_15375 [Lachnospiraceae bacterium]|nr:hypothetical protein [Lachnospiraceae bacterium]